MVLSKQGEKMKKLNVLLIISMLAAALLAANPPGKLVRLEVINGSGDTVYMRLTGRNTGAFYYLTIPAGVAKSFTVLVDSYRRTTWACGGIVSSGSLNMTGNVKLKFVLCGSFPVRHVGWDIDGDGIKDVLPSEYCWAMYGIVCGDVMPNFGEPTQEKVVFWRGYTNWAYAKVGWVSLFNGVGWNSFAIWWKLKYSFASWRTTRFPRGIFMRYRY